MLRWNFRALTILLALSITAAWAVPHRGNASGLPPTEDFQLFKSLPRAGDFEMQTVDGAPLSLTHLKGKVVLMNFWRSNCPFCEKEKQLMRRMLAKLNGSDVTVLSVNLWDPPQWVKRYARDNGGDFLIATRAGDKRSAVDNVVKGRVLGYFVVNGDNEAVYEVKGFPTTYVIDREGRVVASHLGMARWDKPAVSRWVSELAQQNDLTENPRIARSDDSLPEWLHRLLGSGPDMAGRTRRAQGPR